MKTIYKSIAMIAAAALTIASCTPKENLDPTAIPDEQITLKFNIKNVDEVSTKALLGVEEGKNFLNWENNDKIGTYSTGSSNNYNRMSRVSVSGDTYVLNVQTTGTGTVKKIYSYFPYSNGAGTDKNAAVVSIPEIQTMEENGFNADAMPMAGTPVDVNIAISDANTDTPCGEINFSNLGSIIQFKVYSSVDTDETLTSIQYVTSGNIGGAFTVDLEGIDSSNEETLKLTASGQNYTAITTKHHLKPSIGTGADNAIPIYMVVAPGKYADTKVVVTTNKHTYTLDASGEKEFVRSHIKPLRIDIQKGSQGDLPMDKSWVETTLTSLSTSDIFVIVGKTSEGETFAMSNNNGTNSAPSAVSVTIADGKITSEVDSSMQWNISGNATDGYAFYPNGSTTTWLYCTSTNNGVRVGANDAKIFIVESGYLRHSGTSRYIGVYNSTDWRCYTSITGTSNIKDQSFSYYKRVLTEVDTRDKAPISWSAGIGMAEITNEETVYELPVFNNDKGLEVTFSSSDENVATITSAGVVEAKKAGETTISATYTETATSTYKTNTVDYVLTVEDSRTYTITITPPTVLGCTISAYPDRSQKADTEITLSVTAIADGYKFSKWIVKDADENDVAVTDNKFSMPSSNVTISAEFVVDGGDVEVLNEGFDDGTTTDSNAEFDSSKFSNFSGVTSKAYTSRYGGVKLGSSSAVGYITSKSLDLSKPFTVKINVLKYGSDTGKVQVTVGSTIKEITPTTTDTQYSLDFDAATSTSTVKIGTSTKRAYIDNVIIIRHD